MEDAKDAIAVPYSELPADTLRAVIESFVLREGTDYGRREFTLEEKVAHVRQQLERGTARITFDPETHSIDIVTVAPR
jgi:uncharacterized protein